jgi:hypothetical protein
MVVATVASSGALVVGIDETIERRRGKKIAAAGIYRDPVRSNHSNFVKARGRRWVCLMLLARCACRPYDLHGRAGVIAAARPSARDPSPRRTHNAHHPQSSRLLHCLLACTA